MKRLSLGIFSGVLLFVAALVAFLIVQARAPRSDTRDLPQSKADYRMKDIYLQEYEAGDSRWTLNADRAEIFDREGRTVLAGVTITIQEPDQTWTVTGEEGSLATATKDVDIRKKVVLVGSDGVRLETDTLHWEAEAKRVWTDTPVTIYEDGAVVTGQGLESWLAEGRTAVKGRVRATFAAARRAPLLRALPGGGGR
ncbi:MAG: LPS export ABC transporter periplasmic protein LptC [Candidatus Methylomirabilia bacterium]